MNEIAFPMPRPARSATCAGINGCKDCGNSSTWLVVLDSDLMAPICGWSAQPAGTLKELVSINPEAGIAKAR